MSKWKTAIHTIKRAFMCCIRCVEVTERMTRTASEEEKANQEENNFNHMERKSSIAKIVITKDGNEEHIEYTQPISIRYMGDVHIHNESHYYTPEKITPIATPKITPKNSNEDLYKYVELALKDSPRSQMFKRMQRRTVDALEGKHLQRSVESKFIKEEQPIIDIL